MLALAWSSSGYRCALVVTALAIFAAGAAQAKVFHSRSEALELAFPEADRVLDETILLDDEQLERVQKIARSDFESRIVRVYRGFREEKLLGYAFIDVFNVRTLSEALLVVLSPEGTVRALRVLAFHEPLEYLPTERWYEQFVDASLARTLRVGQDVHGVVGATLSAQATTRAVRRALAFFEVVLKGGS
jgi:Na+-translocating ferredoxin:NAD+ oxidoreductase RnfG subunit